MFIELYSVTNMLHYDGSVVKNSLSYGIADCNQRCYLCNGVSN